MTLFGRFWRGEYSLPRSFWGFYVLGYLAAFLVLTLAAIPFFLLHLHPFGRILQIGYFVYPLWAGIGVWRSAKAYPFTGAARFWAWAAQGVVLVFGLVILFNAANGGALRVAAVLME
jgi:hypothetical protein